MEGKTPGPCVFAEVRNRTLALARLLAGWTRSAAARPWRPRKARMSVGRIRQPPPPEPARLSAAPEESDRAALEAAAASIARSRRSPGQAVAIGRGFRNSRPAIPPGSRSLGVSKQLEHTSCGARSVQRALESKEHSWRITRLACRRVVQAERNRAPAGRFADGGSEGACSRPSENSESRSRQER